MKIQTERALFATFIGFAMLFVIAAISTFLRAMWLDGHRVGVILFILGLPSCIVFAYWLLGRER